MRIYFNCNIFKLRYEYRCLYFNYVCPYVCKNIMQGGQTFLILFKNMLNL